MLLACRQLSRVTDHQELGEYSRAETNSRLFRSADVISD